MVDNMELNMSKKDIEKVWSHIETTNSELGICQQKIANIEANVSWLMKFQWLILSTSIASLLLITIKEIIGL